MILCASMKSMVPRTAMDSRLRSYAPAEFLVRFVIPECDQADRDQIRDVPIHMEKLNSMLRIRTLRIIPIEQIALNFRNRFTRWLIVFCSREISPNVHISFQMKLFTSAASAARNLLRVSPQCSVLGSLSKYSIDISMTTPLAPTTQKRTKLEAWSRYNR